MFCSNCGKEITKEANFCSFCGANLHEKVQGIKENWQYKNLQIYWEKRRREKSTLVLGKTEHSFRVDLWSRHQNFVQREVQKHLDTGWEPITSIGPGSFYFTSAVERGFVALYLHYCLIELRRKARPLSNEHVQLLGSWVELERPSNNIAARLWHGKREPLQLQFLEDLTFVMSSRLNYRAVGTWHLDADRSDVGFIVFREPNSFLQDAKLFYEFQVTQGSILLKTGAQGEIEFIKQSSL